MYGLGLTGAYIDQWFVFESEAQKYIEAEKAKAIAQVKVQLEAEAKKQQELITEYENKVMAKERDLSNELTGFKIGILPPAYATTQAGVLVRDPLTGKAVTGPTLPKKKESWVIPALLLGGVVYFFYKAR